MARPEPRRLTDFPFAASVSNPFGGSNPYDSIPQISSPAVRFLDVTESDSLINPAGPNQLYRFEAQAPGRATITFRTSGTSVVVSNVVEVR